MKVQFRDLPDPANAFDSFYSIAPRDKEGGGKAIQQLEGMDYPRQELFELLSCYNRTIENDVSDSLEKLKQGRACVVTGQQLGLFSGPSLMILKAVTTLRVAKDLNLVPIFWLATEDHDVGEIDHTYLLDALGNLEKIRITLAKRGYFVEDLPILNRSVIEHFYHRFHITSKITDFYAETMACFMATLFQGTGLVFLEPKLLRPLARSFFKKELVEAKEIQHLLHKTRFERQELGVEAIFSPYKTNLFFKNREGKRVKIEESASFINLVEKNPERFSTNAISRPVLQSKMIPTAIYVAGPSEMLYHQELKTYHAFHGIKMPWIVPRIHGTFIPKEPADWLLSMEKRVGDVISSDFSSQDSFKHHYLRNLILPKNHSQEQVLNFLTFQSTTKERLIPALVDLLTWNKSGWHDFFLS